MFLAGQSGDVQMARTFPPTDRRSHWWAWFTVALFLLVPVDLLTTLLAVAQHGIGVETNPLVRWLLHQGLVAVAAANLVAGLLAVGLFDVAVRAVDGASGRWRGALVHGVDAWVGLALVAGLALTANNLMVVV